MFNNKFKDFTTSMLVDTGAKAVDITSFDGQMAVCVSDGAVLISREQATKFFGINDTGITIDMLIKKAEEKLNIAIDNKCNSNISRGTQYWWNVIHFLAHNAGCSALDDKYREKALKSIPVTTNLI